MKELKRISAFFMAMLMMLTVFSAFSVVSAEGEAAGGTQPVWPAPGSIKLDKDAAAVEGAQNLWEVTLGIQGKTSKPHLTLCWLLTAPAVWKAISLQILA